MTMKITDGLLFTSIIKYLNVYVLSAVMDLHGVGFYFIYYYFSYLLREAMCSSVRPPSPSSTMNNLSLSSLGCTGKLFRKISVKRLEG